MKLEIHYKKKTEKRTNSWRLKTCYYKIKVGQWWNQTGNQNIPEEKWKCKHNTPKSMGCNKNSSKKEVYSNTGLPQEITKLSNKQPNLPSKKIYRKNKKQSSKSAEGRK